jgi:hypothetical protein
MSMNPARLNAANSLSIQTLLSSLILVMGLVLMIYMIRVESEPGALPLLMVIVGLGWLTGTLVRARTNRANQCEADRTDP